MFFFHLVENEKINKRKNDQVIFISIAKERVNSNEEKGTKKTYSSKIGTHIQRKRKNEE